MSWSVQQLTSKNHFNRKFPITVTSFFTTSISRDWFFVPHNYFALQVISCLRRHYTDVPATFDVIGILVTTRFSSQHNQLPDPIAIDLLFNTPELFKNCYILRFFQRLTWPHFHILEMQIHIQWHLNNKSSGESSSVSMYFNLQNDKRWQIRG